MKPTVSNEKFIVLWQRASNPSDVAKELGKSKVFVCAKAVHLRKHGVALKRFPRVGPSRVVNWAALADLAKSTAA